jgi:hypothetical protein
MQNNNRLKLDIFLHVILPILIGILIYSLWRGLNIIDSTQKIFPLISTENIQEWVIFNLPDGLWLYSLLSTITIIWDYRQSLYHFMWIILVLCLSLFSELLQAYHCILGTFDIKDIIAYLIAFSVYVLNFYFLNKKLIIFKI